MKVQDIRFVANQDPPTGPEAIVSGLNGPPPIKRMMQGLEKKCRIILVLVARRFGQGFHGGNLKFQFGRQTFGRDALQTTTCASAISKGAIEVPVTSKPAMGRTPPSSRCRNPVPKFAPVVKFSIVPKPLSVGKNPA